MNTKTAIVSGGAQGIGKAIVQRLIKNGYFIVIVDITESTETGALYENKRGEIVEASNVNYVEEVVAQINARHLLSANVAAIRRTDEAQESLMDIMA